MENIIIYLIGFAGVGKLTVARELVKQTGARLVDNHVIANPIFSVRQHFPSAFDAKRLEYLVKVRNIVFEAMVDLAEPEASFVLTNVLYDGENDWYEPVLEAAKKRNSGFFPVILKCSMEENKKRIVAEGRKENFKTVKPSVVDEACKIGIIQFDHPNKLEIDTTNLSPARTAEMILEHIQKMK